MIRSGGHGFCGIERKHLLNILQAAREELGRRAASSSARSRDVAEFADADLIVAADGINSRDPHALCRGISGRRSTSGKQQVRLARHAQAVRRLHLHLRAEPDGAGSRRTPTASTRHLDLHRRDARGNLARGRARRGAMRPRTIALLRAAVRALARRPCADDQRAPSARLAVDQLHRASQRELGARTTSC